MFTNLSPIIRTILLSGIFVGMFVAAFPMTTYAENASSTTQTASSTAPQTVYLAMDKAISGVTHGFSLSDFSYQITGNGISEVVPHGSSIALEIGTYTIEELVPSGFFKSDWRIGWYGECEAGSAYSTTVTIDDGNIDHGTLACQADNQYRPDNGDNPEFGCTDSGANNFDIGATEDDGSCLFDPVPVLGCTDPTANNFDIDATEDDGSCLFGDAQLFVIDGFVWHDLNEDGIIDENEDRLEDWELQLVNGSTTFSGFSDANGYFSFSVEAGTWVLSEVLEDGWSQIFPTPTSYTIVVPDDLNIQEDVVSLSFPLNLFFTVAQAQTVSTAGPFNFGNVLTSGGGGGGGSTFSCIISADKTVVPQGTEAILTWDAIGATSVVIDNGVGSTTATGSISVIVPSSTTYTLTAVQGNNIATCSVPITTSGGGGGGHGGGHSNRSGGGGGDTAPDSSGSGGGSSPEPKVLGAQVSVIPEGAPNAGGGGASPMNPARILAVFITFATLFGVSRMYRV